MKKTKVAIVIIVFLIVFVVGFFAGYKMYKILSKKNNSEENKVKDKYSYELYDIGIINYDEMAYLNNFYYREIFSYKEFLELNLSKALPKISENDFKNKFIVVVAIENTSMLELAPTKVYKKNEKLYIDFEKNLDKKGFDNYNNSIVIMMDNSLKSSDIQLVNMSK